MSDYNGYTNYETWNVKLHIDNEEWLYREYMHYLRTTAHPTYQEFIANICLEGSSTPYDNIPWISGDINYTELDEVFQEDKNELFPEEEED